MNKSIDCILNHAESSEKAIEKHLVKRVKSLGGVCLKYSNMAETGYPDRLAVLPGGKVFFAELKSKGKKPTALQVMRMDELMDLGVSCYVCDSKGGVDEVVDYYADLLGL